jgi:murein tripeptide amidase MpaA
MRHHFGCLAMTLEMPFKDSAITPDAEFGWSPERAMKLGASQLDAIRSVLDRL